MLSMLNIRDAGDHSKHIAQRRKILPSHPPIEAPHRPRSQALLASAAPTQWARGRPTFCAGWQCRETGSALPPRVSATDVGRPRKTPHPRAQGVGRLAMR